MKKGIFEWAILIWTSLLVLLITGWIMMNFYDWKDTIVAAIIAFAGAVIGGLITLMGVNRTIQESRRKEETEQIKVDMASLSNLSSFLMNIKQKVIYAKNNTLNPLDTIKVFVNDLSKYNGEALLWIIDQDVAEHYRVVFTFIHSKATLFEIFDEINDTPEQFYLTLEMELGGCIATIEEKIEILLKKYELY